MLSVMHDRPASADCGLASIFLPQHILFSQSDMLNDQQAIKHTQGLLNTYQSYQ